MAKILKVPVRPMIGPGNQGQPRPLALVGDALRVAPLKCPVVEISVGMHGVDVARADHFPEHGRIRRRNIGGALEIAERGVAQRIRHEKKRLCEISSPSHFFRTKAIQASWVSHDVNSQSLEIAIADR